MQPIKVLVVLNIGGVIDVAQWQMTPTQYCLQHGNRAWKVVMQLQM